MTAFETLARQGGIDLQALTPLQRVLLVTDGTVTEILEAHFLEPIRLIKLSQQLVAANETHRTLGMRQDEVVLERRILLRGADSNRIYVHAESFIAVERLAPRLHDELLASDTPLGRLWLEHKLETFKEPLHMRRRAAGELAAHFGGDETIPLVERSYRVTAGGKPVMVICEAFGGM